MRHRDPAPVSIPILPATDLAVSAAFYEQLGFDVDHYDARYAFVGVAGTELFHLEVTDVSRPGHPATAYLHVPDVDHTHATWWGVGVAVGELMDRPWGMREFEVKDPFGNTLRVGSNG